MYGVEFLGKDMRHSFTEEILEGANQLLVSQNQMKEFLRGRVEDGIPIENLTLSV